MANKRTEGITIPVDVELRTKLTNLEASIKKAFDELDKLDVGKSVASSLSKR